MIEKIIIEDRAIIERWLARSLEYSLNEYNLKEAKINLDFYYDHIRQYGSTDLFKYCNLRNRYSELKNYYEKNEILPTINGGVSKE